MLQFGKRQKDGLALRQLDIDHSQEKPGVDMHSGCVFAAAGFLALYIALGDMVQFLYGSLLFICCLFFLGGILKKSISPAARKILGLSCAMALWFLFLQIKQNSEGGTPHSVELFFSSCLFALPFAFLVEDQHRRWWLKFFAAAFLAGTVVMAGFSYMLILECLPEALAEYVYWDGARLCAFRHPNIAACYLMIGVGYGLSFFLAEKTLWKKAAFAIILMLLLGVMAFTNSRTTILATGALLGSSLCFSIFKGKRKMMLFGVVLAAVVIVGIYAVFGKMYQKNHDQMLEEYTAQYQQQQAQNSETEEPLPIYVNPITGEITLKMESGQNTLLKDFLSLNGRVVTWQAVFQAVKESPDILFFGTDNPGNIISQYRTDYVIHHAHNSWLEALLGMGLPGFVLVMLLTFITLWNCFLTLWKDHADVWKRNTALLTLCLMVAAFLEPYLFLAKPPYHPVDMTFMLCAGYLACWQGGHRRKKSA